MHRHAFKAAAAAAVLSVVVVGMAAAAVIRSAGPQPDGTAITPQGWRVTPAGSQTDLGLWPMDVAMSPTGNLAARRERRLRPPLADGDRPDVGRRPPNDLGCGSQVPRLVGFRERASDRLLRRTRVLARRDTTRGPRTAPEARSTRSASPAGRSPRRSTSSSPTTAGTSTPGLAGIAVSDDGNRLYVAGEPRRHPLTSSTPPRARSLGHRSRSATFRTASRSIRPAPAPSCPTGEGGR